MADTNVWSRRLQGREGDEGIDKPWGQGVQVGRFQASVQHPARDQSAGRETHGHMASDFYMLLITQKYICKELWTG